MSLISNNKSNTVHDKHDPTVSQFDRLASR